MNEVDALWVTARELTELDQVISVLSWDEETYLPEAARPQRGRQSGTLETIRHQRTTDAALGALLERLGARTDLDPTARALTARLARRRALAVRVPERLVRAIAEARACALAAWLEARREGRFALFARALGELVELSRERAAALAGPGASPYDALVDEYEPGMSAARLTPLFATLRAGLLEILERIRGGTPPDARRFQQAFSLDAQWTLSLEVLRLVGFDLERGRLDRSAHPFSSGHGEADVRLTTRLDESDPLSALYSTIHEAGHGMYEQGWSAEHSGTPLASSPSFGLHESQSRLWENQVGRSRAFWTALLPRAKALFPAQLDGATVDEVYRAVNVVEPGLVRTEADEVTYNLHIILRFELEAALFSGALPVDALPEAWSEKMRALLGVVPDGDRLGCLQDIHWASAAFGYFPSYTVGNLYAASLMSAYRAHDPGFDDACARGELGGLLAWLRREVHARGYIEEAEDTVRRATGQGLSVEPLLAALRAKYFEVYRV
jgi:carboxypeptidase Taq